MSKNDEVANRLAEFADLLEAQDVEYKPRAYRDAAENVRDLSVAIEGLVADGQDAVSEIDAVGEAISTKIVEYIETGEIEELVALRAELPVEMEALTRVEGVGPKTVGKLYEELGIQTLDDLESAAESGKIQEINGFGPKTEQNILDGIPFAREAHERQLLAWALPRGERVRDFLGGLKSVNAVELAGSIRRRKPTIGDVDVLVGSVVPEAVVDAFTAWEELDRVIEAGTSKASVRFEDVRVDLRVVEPEEFGAALQYFTGSKSHNVAVRNRAIERNLKVNEYGVFDVSDVADTDAGQRVGKRVASMDETDVYSALEMAWVPPELRENRGEIEAAATDELPDLLGHDAIRGDLHTHTTWSDGAASVREMAEAAVEFGHEYLAVTDHATGPGMVGGVGLDDAALREQLSEIRDVRSAVEIDLFAGVEANIGADGEISVDDELLAELDIVVAAPHSALDGDGTDRLVTAATHPDVDIIGHPTGRQLNRRAGMTADIERLAGVAADHGTALEINAHPRRLDLSGHAVQTAINAGATISINTDAHSVASFEHIRFGVDTARRGWAERENVLNTRSVDELRAFLSN